MRFLLGVATAVLVSAGCVNELDAQTISVTAGSGAPLAAGTHKFRLVILGDGFQASEEGQFNNAVATLRSNLFDARLSSGQKLFFAAHADDFDVCVKFIASHDSGVLGPSSGPKTTELGVTYTGKWRDCWFKEDPNVDQKVMSDANDQACVGTPDYVFVIVHVSSQDSDDGGGCARDKIMYVTVNATATAPAHELGHALAALYDEYVTNRDVLGTNLKNERNCATTADGHNVPWSMWLRDPANPDTDTAHAQAGVLGVYEGCDSVKRGAYRPSNVCMMYGMDADFCYACTTVLQAAFAARGTIPAARIRRAGLEPAPRSLRLVISVPANGGEVRLLQTLVGPPAVEFEQISRSALAWILRAGGAVIGRVIAGAPIVERRTVGGDNRYIESHRPASFDVLTMPVLVPRGVKITPETPLTLDLFHLTGGVTLPAIGSKAVGESITHFTADSLRAALLVL